jgi:hypothetical protein
VQAASDRKTTVFVSYRREGGFMLAKYIFDYLHAAGFDVFMDVQSLGAGEFEQTTLAEIAARDYFLLVLTSGSLEGMIREKDWLRKELMQAVEFGRTVVPVLAEGIKFEDHRVQKVLEKLPPALQALPSLNAVRIPPPEYFDSAMERLRSFLKAIADSAPSHSTDKSRRSAAAPKSVAQAQSALHRLTLPPVASLTKTQSATPWSDLLRFTRLFPGLPGASFAQADLEELARAMIAPEEAEQEGEDDPEENRTIPAAYTYLGQFVEHDLTFDPISHLRETLSPEQLKALVDFRTPHFDLNNLYGGGPDDQPHMYKDDGIHMLLGEPLSGDFFDPGAVQLPRGPNGRALIGDPRDDENRIVAQLHAVFLRFHNKVADQLGGKRHVSFQEVRQQVRWHYQWVLVNDFLPRILEGQTYQSVFPDPYRHVLAIPELRENDLELMPVEFSGAAYRFGHSMIRPRYRLNSKIERPIFSSAPGDTADLEGFRPTPADWAIDWQFFIDLGPGTERAARGPSSGPVARNPQLSYKIDTSLAHPLGNLPPRIATNPSSLALRNLERSAIFQLPSGQSVARALGMPVIADEDLVIGKATADGQQKPITEVAAGFAGNAPLWVYILSEAQVASWKNAGSGADMNAIPIRLGPVGSRLVAEVFASLLRGDPTSYLHAEPRFEPIESFASGGLFGLAELINVALGHTP